MVEVLEMLEMQYFFRGFPVLMDSSLRQVFQTCSEICIFCSAIQYIVSQKQPLESAREVLVELSETVFDETHFIVNLHSFLQPLAHPRHIFPQVSSLSSILRAKQLPKLLFSRHIRNSFHVYLFLNSQP